MRITGKQLRQVIREEVIRSMSAAQREGLKFEPEVIAEEDAADVMSDEQVYDSVSATINAYVPQIKAAWEQVLKSDPDAAGKITASWKITKGAVSDIKIIANTTGHKTFGDSVERAIASWKFNTVVTTDVDSYAWTMKAA